MELKKAKSKNQETDGQISHPLSLIVCQTVCLWIEFDIRSKVGPGKSQTRSSSLALKAKYRNYRQLDLRAVIKWRYLANNIVTFLSNAGPLIEIND